MPVNPESRMRQSRNAIHGWKDGDKFYTSLQPRSAKAAANVHDSAIEAMSEASRRGLAIVWDNPAEIE